MIRLIIDASVATKWFIAEVGSRDAEAILASDEQFIAPDLIRPEVGHALWKKVRREGLSESVARNGFAAIDAIFIRLLPTDMLIDVAYELAFRLSHPVYDCLYLALAIQEDDVMVTADEQFRMAVQRSVHASRVRPLSRL